MKLQLIFVMCLCVPYFGIPQKNTFKVPDSLAKKNYTYLDDKIYEFRDDNKMAAIYLLAYLHKSKNEKNWKEVVHAYQNFLHQSPEKLKLVYADSMIYAAKKSNDNGLIGSAYLSKGIAFYGRKQYDLASDNYSIANNYISKSGDKYLIYKVKHQMAQIKFYLGFYDEATSLFRDCLDYFKNENPRAYINTLHSLGLCYNRTGNYELCSKTNIRGLSECKRLKIPEMEPYFINSDGINDFFKQKYSLSISKIKQSLDSIRKSKNFAIESISNFYIGKSYWAMKKINLALPYFVKVDQTFNNKNYLRPDLREMYELLIKYYKDKNDYKTQLYYINQLLKVDAVLDDTYKYLIGIHKEYSTEKLLAEKEKIDNKTLRQKYYTIIMISISSIILIVATWFAYRYTKNRNRYKNNYKKQKAQFVNAKNTPTAKPEKPQILNINPDTVSAVLKQLEKFEKDKKFLERDWTLVTLAAALKSNPKYLSSIISHYREKGFTDYINEIRIDYITTLLYTERKFSNYTYTALAEEAGFSSTQRFTNAFLAKTGMSPSFFIRQIRKEQL